MKNSQKKQINKVEIEKELLELEKSSEKKEKKKKAQIAKKETKQTEEFYDPSLKPKSTIYYEEKGAKISDVKVTTLDGEEVNVLVQGEKYILQYRAEIIDISNKIHFGMHFKDITGNVLAGSVFPSREEFILAENKQYIISFEFLNYFNQSDIFCSVGIKSNQGVFLHRIIDAYCYKIKNMSDKYTGLTILAGNGKLR